MKSLILLLTSLFLQPIFAAVPSLPTEWKPVEIPGIYKAWENSKKPGQIITIFKNKSAKPVSFESASQLDIASGIISLRQVTLEQFGFSNFTVQNFDYVKIVPYEKITLQGSYRRPDHAMIQFLEHQYYRQQAFFQVSYMSESQEKKISSDEEKLLSTLAPQSGDF